MRNQVLYLAGIVAAGLVLGWTSSASAAVSCDRVASPAGSDSAAGTAAAPFKTPQKLVDSLSTGQTGCFRAGITTGSASISKQNLTLTSYPGERGTVKGRIWVTPQGDGTTVTNLNLDGRPGVTSPTISADNATFRGNDVTDYHTAICFAVVDGASGTVIENNNIHDCGELPATNQDHGIYVADATNTTIHGNWIHHNADRGIQLYPNADSTTITGNVIDSNGSGIIFGAGYENGTYETPDNNTVTNNLITNAQVRDNIESSGKPNGSGNVVTHNCIKGAPSGYGGPGGSGILDTTNGFTATNSLIASPGYVNAAAGDYRILTPDQCSALLVAVGVDPSLAPLDSQPVPPPATTTPPSTTTTDYTGKTTKPKKKRKRRRRARSALTTRGTPIRSRL